jgi:hypothetical protein
VTRPDHRTLQAAHTLEALAPDVTLALTHLNRERSICDGYPTRGDGTGRGTADASTTEAEALASEHYTAKADLIRQTLDTITRNIELLGRVTQRSIGVRAPIAVPRCRDNQMGRQGAIEWGDPTCENLPDKAGLCSACYQRERRWRQAHGLAPRDIEDAA